MTCTGGLGVLPMGQGLGGVPAPSLRVASSKHLASLSLNSQMGLNNTGLMSSLCLMGRTIPVLGDGNWTLGRGPRLPHGSRGTS